MGKVLKLFSWSSFLLMITIIIQVILRYGFNQGIVALEELQWHFYAILILTGLSFAELNRAHVRVDIISHRFSRRTNAIIEIFGYVFLLFPFLFIVFYHSLPFVADSFSKMESSVSSAGLPYRWIIKSFIPLSMILFFLSALSNIFKNIKVIKRGSE
jgi:TRAP-type mannitol/chloroaromatic compound transport system permease small subunit